MLFNPPLEEAILLKRYKRFLADVRTLEGEELCIHCPNTGSMLNCMAPGAKVWFSRSTNPARKLPGTWELVETPQKRLACINTGRANALVEEALMTGVIEPLMGFTRLRREVRYGQENSRVDFCLDYPEGSLYLEVKSVTLGFDETSVAAFPDAKTERGAKHLRELTALARAGQRAALLYCVNLAGVSGVRPAREIDLNYAKALDEAKAAGVRVLAYGVKITPSEIRLEHSLAVLD